jgi:hypothetical protein
LKINSLNKYPDWIEILFTILLVLTVNFISYKYQYQISHNNGMGMDGVEYYKIADDFNNNLTPEARAPFVYRIGTPYLAHLVSPTDLILGFKIINIVSGSLIPIVLLFWISLFSRQKYIRLLIIVLFSLTWHSPLRLSWYYPVHSDPLAILVMLKLLVLLHFILIKQSNRNLLITSFSILTVAGVFIREICLIPSVLLIISDLDFFILKEDLKKSRVYLKNKLYIFPFILGMIVILILHLTVHKNNSYSFINAAYGWIYRKSLLMYLHSWLLAFGPVLFIIIYKWRDSLRFLKLSKISSAFIIILSFMGLAGGSDTERLLYWSMPVIYIMLASVINSNINLFKGKFLIIYLSILQLINMRVFWLIPDYPNNSKSILPFLTPMDSKFPLLDLWVWHADLKVNLVSFAGYIISFLVFILIVRYREKRISTSI